MAAATTAGVPGGANSNPAEVPKVPDVSVVSCAFNEAKNLPYFLDSILASEGSGFKVTQIIVVASGCTDDTVPLLRAARQKDHRVVPIIQPERDGKVSALRVGLQAASGDFVLIEGADTVLGPGAIAEVSRAFAETGSQVVTLRPAPAGIAETLTARLALRVWDLHHEVSLITPKPGEAYAIRRDFTLPDLQQSEDDDTLVGQLVGAAKARAVYCPEAVVYNRSPATFRDFVLQRMRIARLVVRASRRLKTRPKTWDPVVVVQAAARVVRKNRSSIPDVVILCCVETLVRAFVWATCLIDRRPLRVWDQIQSTKEPVIAPLGRSASIDSSPTSAK